MSKNPILIPQPFANNGSKNSIQNTRQAGQDPEDATWSDGFPNVTMQPIESGGLPPKGMDFNGILNALSASIVHQQKGGFFYFDQDYAKDINGYSAGAVLLADDNSRLFISTTSKNKTNPNQNSTGWEILAGNGLNSDTASKLKTPRYINGVAFDGSADINVTPPGAVQFFAMNWVPPGFLKANGAEVSRTTYANLFAAIGFTYGQGDGKTTFNLPDLRSEFVRGWDDGRGVDIGRIFGDTQADAIRNITGRSEVLHVQTLGLYHRQQGALKTVEQCQAGAAVNMGTTNSMSFIEFDASKCGIPVAGENRPRNVALLACIKI